MRFLSAKKNCTVLSHGAKYDLNPISYPHVNINDILASEFGYVYRTVKELPDDVQAIKFEAEKIPGFPRPISDVSKIPSGSRLIIMRVGGLGDMIMLTPVLKHLKEALPVGVETTLCTFKYAHNLFLKSGFCEKVVSAPIRLSELLEYDYYMEFIEEKDKEDFSKSNMTEFYFKSMGVNPDALAPLQLAPYLPSEVACSTEIASFFKRMRKADHRAVALTCMFSSDRSRDFPVPHLESLLDRFPEVLFVAPYNRVDPLRERFEHITKENLIFLDTSRSLTEFITAIHCSDLILSSDSSAYHIAAAFGKPAVALFGSIDPDLRTRYYPSVTPLNAVYKGTFCTSPCRISNVCWIHLDDEAGQEMLKRNIFDPEKGCPEAVRTNSKYSPCLLAVSYDDLAQAFAKTLNRISGEKKKCSQRRKMSAKRNTPKMNPTNDKLISACLIVKNEAELLPQCLASIKDAVDEIIVVDTGSTDRSVEIAESFGARVYHHPWENDFSKHRNQSLSYASGKWILIIDADEKLDQDSVPLIRKAVHESKSPLIAGMVRNFQNEHTSTGGGLSVRLFRNQMGFHYEGIVHNQLKFSETPVYFPYVIWHYGYDLGEEKKMEKFMRSLPLLIKQAQRSPEDHVTRHHLAVTYFAVQDWENAYCSAVEAQKLFKQNNKKELSWNRYIVCFSLYKMGRLEDAIQMAQKGLAEFPNSIDLHYLLACKSLDMRDFDAVIKHAKSYFHLKEKYEENPTQFGLDFFETDQKEGDVSMALGFATYFQNEKDRALEFFRSAAETLRDNKNDKLAQIGNFYFNRHEYENALPFYNLIDIDNTTFNRNLLKIPACLDKLGRHSEAVQFYEQLHQIFPTLWEPLFDMGLCLLKQNDHINASQAFKEAHEADPQNVDTLVNWGFCLVLRDKKTEAEEKYLCALMINPDDPQAVLNLALLYYQSGDYTQALPGLKKVLQSNPGHSYAALALCDTFVQTGEIEPVVPLCEQVLQQLGLPADSTLQSLKQLGGLFYAISESLLSRGDFAAHGIAYRIGHRLIPGDPAPLLSLSQAALGIGASEAAQKLLDYVSAAYPVFNEPRLPA